MLPPFVGKYWVSVLTVLAINAIVLMSFRLITTAGLWSFAHVVMMGLGSYTSAFLTVKYFDWPFWLVLPLGGLAASLFALIVSYPLLRTKGFFFFLTSFAAGEAMRQAWVRFKNPFESYLGISPVMRPILFGAVASTLQYYYVVLTVAFLCLFILYQMDKSRTGDTLKAIALNENMCKSVGINVWRYKTLALVVGSFFAGIGGVLFAHHNIVVAPGDFTTVYMFKFVGFALVGGTATFGGPLVGLVLLTLVTELSRDIPEWVPFIYGVVIIIILLFLPGGLGSLPRRMSPLFKKWILLARKQL